MSERHALIAAGANPKLPSPFQVKCEFHHVLPQIRGNPLDPSGIRIYAIVQKAWRGAAYQTLDVNGPNDPQLNDYTPKYRPNIQE